MSLLFIDSFDHYDRAWIPYKWSGWSGGFTREDIVGSGRGATSCLRITRNSGTGYVYKLFTPSSELFIGMAFKQIEASWPNTWQIYLGADTGAVQHVIIGFASGGQIRAGRGDGTVLGTGTTVFQTGTYYYIEIRAIVHDSAGEIEVRVNGTSEIDLSGVDTRNGGTSTQLDRIYMNCEGGIAHGFDVEDLYILNGDGTSPNGFLGDVRVLSLLPSADGSTTDFTPSTGSNYQNVDDSTPNSDTDYNYSASAGDLDLFALQDLPDNVGIVHGLAINLTHAKSDAGSRSARAVIRSSGSNYESSDITPNTSYNISQSIWGQNPDTTSDFTTSDINSIEAGYTVEA